MATHAHPAHDDALHRTLAAAWRVLQATARAIARFATAVANQCRGSNAHDKPLCRSERKRLRKAKLRQLESAKKAA